MIVALGVGVLTAGWIGSTWLTRKRALFNRVAEYSTVQTPTLMTPDWLRVMRGEPLPTPTPTPVILLVHVAPSPAESAGESLVRGDVVSALVNLGSTRRDATTLVATLPTGLDFPTLFTLALRQAK